MKSIREALHELERRAEVAELNENQSTARLLRKSVALVEAAAKEDERAAHQCLEQELDLRTASSLSGIPYSTLARKVQQGAIRDRGVGGRRRVRVGDLPCEAGWLARLLGLDPPEGDSPRDPDSETEETISEEELEEYRRERRRRIA